MRVTSDVGPFSITPEWVLDADISDRAVRLYGLLGRYADANGSSFPLRRTLLKRLRCSESSLDRAAKELVAIGALHIEHRKGDDGNNQANLWTLLMSSPVTRGGVTGATTPGVTGDTQNESQVERETPLAAAPRENGKQRAPNEQWDALKVMFGEPTTRPAQKLRGQVCAELRAAGATGPEILARGKRWPHHFENATLTETALLKHWDRLGRKPLRAGR